MKARISENEAKFVSNMATQVSTEENNRRKNVAKLTAKKAYLEKQAMSATTDADKEAFDAKIAEAAAEIKTAETEADQFKAKGETLNEYQANKSLAFKLKQAVANDRKNMNLLIDDIHAQIDANWVEINAMEE